MAQAERRGRCYGTQAAPVENVAPSSGLEANAENLPRVPYAYHNYKAKCLNDGLEKGLACTKTHSHEREVISDVEHTARALLRACSCGVRLAKILSKEFTWTLWKQTDVAKVLQERLDMLWKPGVYKSKCKCGNSKLPISSAKLDAAQFFKAASASRGMQRICEMLGSVSEKLGFEAVAVSRSKPITGKFCKAF